MDEHAIQLHCKVKCAQKLCRGLFIDADLRAFGALVSICSVNTQPVGFCFLVGLSDGQQTVDKRQPAHREQQDESYRLGAEFGGEDVADGGEQLHVELRAQAQEVAEGEDDHLFGMSVHPLLYLCENSLPGKHKDTF